MRQNTKDWIQHISAATLIASAIAMAFVSFFLTLDIGAGPLTYIGEALSAALGLFGISTYFMNRFDKFQRDVREELRRGREFGMRNEELGMRNEEEEDEDATVLRHSGHLKE